MIRCNLLPTTAALAVAALAPAAAHATQPTIRTANGPDAASIQATVDQFRADLGGADNGVGGTFDTGRRQVNWDGVPDDVASPNTLPADFFNATSPRGLVTGASSSFRVSADSPNPTDTPVRFGDLNAAYPSAFTTFSAQRLFTGADHVTSMTFRIPGTDRRAATSGLGVVFTDVDAPGTSIELFNDEGKSVAQAFASTHSGGLSFVGIKLPGGSRAAYARITAGNADMPADDAAGSDVVALDDVIYGEPQAVAGEGTGFEKGLGEFDTHAPIGAPGGWTRGTGAAHAGAMAAFAAEPAGLSERTLVRRKPFTVPANAAGPRLRFRHFYRLEQGFDGGVLEVTTDGGQTWKSPPASQYLTNPPDGALQSGNPLAGSLAWSGVEDKPMTLSTLDLSPYKGKSIRFRFVLATDALGTAPPSSIPNGWYIDDVKVAGV
jgi:hypothetical protein